jgi:sugar lactone lactonase YvrE
MKRSLAALWLVACAHTSEAPPPATDKDIIQAVQAGNDAYKRKDYDEFLRQARRAAEMSPENPDLQARVARALVLDGKAPEGLALLQQILALGVVYDLDRKDWDAVRKDPAFARARDQVTANLSPRTAGDVLYTLPATDLIAEAIGWDETTRAFYVSSVHQRKLLKIDEKGAVTDFIPAETRHWGLFGLQIDTARRRLWVGTAALPQVDGFAKADDGLAGVLLVDLDRGEVKQRFVPPDRGHAFGDLGLAPNGDLWVSDSVGGGVWKIPADASTFTPVIAPGRLKSPQGIAFAEDGGRAYISDYTSGLWVYDVAAARLAPVRFPDGTLVYGIDGLARAGQTLWAVQNGATPHRLSRFALASGGDAVTRADIVERGPALVAPTSGVIAGGAYVYIAVSQWESFDDDGKQNASVPVEIRRIKL